MVGMRPRPGKGQKEAQSRKPITTMSKEPATPHEVPRKLSRNVPKTKVTVACNFCRRRKIRCDNGRPRCSHCRLYENTCEYTPTTTSRGRPPKVLGTDSSPYTTSNTSSASASTSSYIPVLIPDLDQPLSSGLPTNIVDQPMSTGLPDDIVFDMSLLSNTTATPSSWTSQLLETASHSPQSIEAELALLYANSSPNLVQDPLFILDPSYIIAPDIPPSILTSSSTPDISSVVKTLVDPASPPLTPRADNIESYSRAELVDIWYNCHRLAAPCWSKEQAQTILARQEVNPTKASTLFYHSIRWLCIAHLRLYGPFPKEETEVIHHDVMDALMDARSHQDYVDLTGALVNLAAFLVCTQGFRQGAAVYFRLAAGTIERTVKDDLHWRLKSIIWMWDIIIHRVSGTSRCMDKLEQLKGWEEFQDEDVQVAPVLHAIISFLVDIDSLYTNQPVDPIHLSIQLQSRLKSFMDSIPDIHKVDKVSDDNYVNARETWNVPSRGLAKNSWAMHLSTLYHFFTIVFTKLLIPDTGPTNDHRRRMRISAMQAMDSMSWSDADNSGKRNVFATRFHEPFYAIIGGVFLDEAEARHEAGPSEVSESPPPKPFLPSLLVMLEWVKDSLAISNTGLDPLPANIRLEQRIDNLFTSIGHEFGKN